MHMLYIYVYMWVLSAIYHSVTTGADASIRKTNVKKWGKGSASACQEVSKDMQGQEKGENAVQTARMLIDKVNNTLLTLWRYTL